MIGFTGIRDAEGLPSELRSTIEQLVTVGAANQRRNLRLSQYYDGEIVVEDRGKRVSAKKLRNDQVCYWPEAVVDKLAERIRLESFVTKDGPDETLDAIMDASNVINEYASFLPSKLVHGPMFCAVNNTAGGVRLLKMVEPPRVVGRGSGHVRGARRAHPLVERTRADAGQPLHAGHGHRHQAA